MHLLDRRGVPSSKEGNKKHPINDYQTPADSTSWLQTRHKFVDTLEAFVELLN